MKRNLQGFAAAGSLFLAMCAAEAAFAQKPGGVLKIYHRDSPASMSILEEATNSTEIPMMGVFNNLVPISKAALVPSAGEHFENPGKSGLAEVLHQLQHWRWV